MNVKRFFNIFLCLMMLLSLFPAVQVFADAVSSVDDSDVESYSSIAEIIGQKSVPYKTFDFTQKTASTLYTGSEYMTSGIKYFDLVTGLNLDSTTKDTYWRYSPVASWFTLGDRRAIAFRARLADESNPLNVFVFEPAKSYAPHHVTLTASGIDTSCPYSSLDSGFSPGTEWVDYLMVKTANGFRLYASKKNVLYGRWIPVLETTGVGTGSSSYGGLHFIGTGAVESITIYNTGVTEYGSLGEITGGNVASAYDFQLNEDFVKTNGLTYTGSHAYGENGLTLTEGGWNFLPASGWYAMGQDKAVMFRAKVTDAAETMTIRVSDSRGTAKVILSSTGLTAYSGVGAAKKNASFSGTEWADYLILQYPLGGYSVYATNDTVTEWYKIAEADDYTEGADGSLGIDISGSGMVQFVKQLEIANAAAEKEARPADAETAYYQEEFNAMPTGQSNVRIENGRIENCSLILTGTEEEGSSYTVRNGGIPLGGYGEFRIKTGASGEFVTSDGSGSIRISFQDGVTALSADTTQEIDIGDGGNRFRTWRIVRNNNGTYTGYCKTEGDTGWYPAFSDVTGKTESLAPVTSLTVSGGTMVCDYLTIYGPTDDAPLILTDGYGTKVITDGAAYQFHDCIRALVTLDESKSQTILFAEYTKGALSHWKREEVPAGNGTLSVPYAVKNIASNIKVFLWDSLSGMAAAGKAQAANHNWTLSGNAKDLNGGFSLNLERAGESQASFAGEIGEDFDIEWTMRISFFSGFESAHIYTGKHRIALTFGADGISYQTNAGTETISCAIGTVSHNYRLVGKKGVCYLYLDGEFVAELSDFPESNEEARLDFRAGN